MFFNLVTLGFLGHLTWFHVYLIRENKTTFQHIKEQEAIKAGLDEIKQSKLFKSTGVNEAVHKKITKETKAPLGVVCVSLCNLPPGLISKPAIKPKLAGLKAISAED